MARKHPLDKPITVGMMKKFFAENCADNHYDDWVFCIAPHGMKGFPGTPKVDICGFSFGFDWDAGNIFLHTDPRLWIKEPKSK